MSGYIGASPVPQATQHRQAFTATASQTSFPTVGYTPQFVDVYLNGIKLAAEDYTATNGSDIVLTTGAALDDILEYVAYTPFEVASQTFTGTTTVSNLVATSVSAGTLVAGTATYGGTADVITITTGLSLTALTTGMEIRFRATAANTGATTINVDAIGAVTALTVISTGLPADYIRTDVDTVIRYNGTNWVADREPELGSNANGEYKRWADGTVQAWFFRKAVGDGTAVVPTYTWTLPVAFITTFAGDSRIGFNLSVIGYVNTGGHVYITATNGVALSIQQTGHQIYTDGYTTATMTVKTTVSSSYSSARFVTQRMSAFGTWY